MTNQLRAKKGGQIGANGEFYKGGAFIATTDKYSKGHPKPKKQGKVEIQPYVWEIPPSENAISIWSQIQHFVKFIPKFGPLTNVVCISVSEQTIEHYKLDLEVLGRLQDLFNAGERWIDF